MLTRIAIKNFRSLRDVELDMQGLTVLIGPNGGGKSNLLDVFALMAEAAKGGLNEGILRRGGGGALLYRSRRGGLAFEFEFASGEFESTIGDIHYSLEVLPLSDLPIVNVRSEKVYSIGGDTLDSETPPLTLVHREYEKLTFLNDFTGAKEDKRIDRVGELAISQIKDRTSYPIPYELLSELENWTLYRPIRVDSGAAARAPQMIRHGLRLLPDGSNLSSVLYSIKDQHLVLWTEICEILGLAYPGFRALTFPPEGGDGKIVLRWAEDPHSDSFSATLLSDGTLRFLSLLAILKSPNPPPLICIEEPEIGLHPDWIKIVAELLESAATRTQIIVATHSPELVSHVQPEHVVVVEKENGQSTFARLKEDELSAWLDKFRLGDLWLSGEIGGRP